MKDEIFVKGAKENNLKNIDVHIPRNTLTVFTGLSGSGKSTLAFDTIFAEGQRRYVESLSSYARQFLGQMEKPNVESIEGLSPAISIDQKTTSHNPRSTVGTVTEIYDYMRLLFARIGVPHCPKCGREIRRQTVDEIADKVMAMPQGSKILINAPVVRGRKGEYTKNLESFRKSGYGRVKIDGIVYDLQEDIHLPRLRHQHRRDRAAPLLLQYAVRRLSRVFGVGLQTRHRSRPDLPRQDQNPARGGHQNQRLEPRFFRHDADVPQFPRQGVQLFHGRSRQGSAQGSVRPAHVGERRGKDRPRIQRIPLFGKL